MRLRDRVAKVDGSGAHREYAAARTYERVRPYFPHLGITRLADVTGLDRLGIPVYNAIVPRSNDSISVYSGKGPTPADAKTSAVMEVVERFSGWLPLRPTAVASYRELSAGGHAVLRPAAHNIGLLARYHDELPIYWVAGHDLLGDEPVLVPHDAVCYASYPGAPPCYELTTSNGLASGNSLEEAICHALCELIERDAMTIAEVVGGRLAEVLTSGLVSPRLTPAEAARFTDRATRLDPDTVPPSVRPLVDRFRDAGLRLQLRSIGSDLGIPTVTAYASDDSGRPYPPDGIGHGTHPDLEIALTRAITECAQSRAVGSGGLALMPQPPGAGNPGPGANAGPGGSAGSGGNAGPGGNAGSGASSRPGAEPGPSGRTVPVSTVASYPSDDIVADIRLLLERLRAAGLDRVVVVDLSPPQLPGHVVRVLVPGLESWAIDRSKLGDRATRAWARAVQEVDEAIGPVRP